MYLKNVKYVLKMSLMHTKNVHCARKKVDTWQKKLNSFEKTGENR